MTEQHSYENIPRLLRDLREAAGKTQEQLAEALVDHGKRVSRFVINRIEKGHVVLGQELAIALDSFARTESLQNSRIPTHGFSALVGEKAAYSVDHKRGIDLAKLLSAPDLTEILIVLCDESDLAFHVRSGLGTAQHEPDVTEIVPRRIVLVVPSRERVQELFGADAERGAEQRGELYGGYADRLWKHLVTQVHRFERLAGQSEGVAVEVFESRAVLNPVVVAKSRERTTCLSWPCAPSRSHAMQPEFAPIVAGAQLATWYEQQVRAMVGSSRSAARRQHFADTFLVDPSATLPEDPTRSGVMAIEHVKFSRFLPRRKLAEYEMDPGEGLAVATVLPYVRSMRSAEAIVEVLLKRRSAVLSGAEADVHGQLGFISSRITATTLWDAFCGRAALGGSLSSDPDTLLARGRFDLAMHYEDQSALVVDRLAELGAPESALAGFQSKVIDEAYRIAAARELEITYGVTFGGASLADRLELTALGDLAVPKPAGGMIIARLFTIRLEPGERDELIALAKQNDGNEIRRVAAASLLASIASGDRSELQKIAEPCGRLDDVFRAAMWDESINATFSAVLTTAVADALHAAGGY